MSTHDRPANSLGRWAQLSLQCAHLYCEFPNWLHSIYFFRARNLHQFGWIIIKRSSHCAFQQRLWQISFDCHCDRHLISPTTLPLMTWSDRWVSQSEEWQRQRDRIPESTQFVDRITVILLVCTDWLKTDWRLMKIQCWWGWVWQ